jgi:hypothetical protein
MNNSPVRLGQMDRHSSAQSLSSPPQTSEPLLSAVSRRDSDASARLQALVQALVQAAASPPRTVR